jgi:hypothetical protein
MENTVIKHLGMKSHWDLVVSTELYEIQTQSSTRKVIARYCPVSRNLIRLFPHIQRLPGR